MAVNLQKIHVNLSSSKFITYIYIYIYIYILVLIKKAQALDELQDTHNMKRQRDK